MSGKWIVLSMVLVGLCLAIGCESDDDDSSSGSSTSYAGTWHGSACGRGLTMIISQNGTTLSGSYALTNPDFSENISGSVSSENPPASATLIGGADRSFRITFNSYNSLGGGYYKVTGKVCDVSATK